MLRKLEDKITAKLMSRMENIVVKKCKAIFEEKKPMLSETAIQTELQIFQCKILNIQNDIKALNNKSDHTIGSLTYCIWPMNTMIFQSKWQILQVLNKA